MPESPKSKPVPATALSSHKCQMPKPNAIYSLTVIKHEYEAALGKYIQFCLCKSQILFSLQYNQYNMKLKCFL